MMASIARQPAGRADDARAPADTILDLSEVDLRARIHDRAYIERYIPHRGQMLFLSSVVWESANFKQGVGVWDVGSDEFWAAGHFPSRPIVPGVLMIEAGAQLACYLYNARYVTPSVVLFIRMDHASFRSSVEPEDTFYLLCNETRGGRRRFSCDVQGFVRDRIAFDCTITGYIVEPAEPVNPDNR